MKLNMRNVFVALAMAAVVLVVSPSFEFTRPISASVSSGHENRFESVPVEISSLRGDYGDAEKIGREFERALNWWKSKNSDKEIIDWEIQCMGFKIGDKKFSGFVIIRYRDIVKE